MFIAGTGRNEPSSVRSYMLAKHNMSLLTELSISLLL
jgi:hypothetical protein